MNIMRNCDECGRAFQFARRDHRFCGDRCRQRARRAPANRDRRNVTVQYAERENQHLVFDPRSLDGYDLSDREKAIRVGTSVLNALSDGTARRVIALLVRELRRDDETMRQAGLDETQDRAKTVFEQLMVGPPRKQRRK